jgi:SAM-dependent methyltransferase
MSLLAALRHPREWDYERVRRSVASKWLVGSGIEVGALHRPFPIGADAHVRYLDRSTTSQLRREYPELNDQALVEVDICDNGETLATVDNGSLAFVAASHFLEHCQDPVGTLHNHLRVVRRGGIMLQALPDRRQGIDRYRPATTLEHLYRDHDVGPEVSRAEHYRQWAELVDLRLGNISAEQVETHAAELDRRDYSIHFHCWTSVEFRAHLQAIIDRSDLQAEIVECRTNHHEFLVVLRRH